MDRVDAAHAIAPIRRRAPLDRRPLEVHAPILCAPVLDHAASLAAISRHDLANSSAASRLGQLARPLGHRQQLAATRAQALQLIAQTLGRQIAIGDQHRRAFFDQVLRVMSLVIIHGRRKRHEDRADSGRGQLGHRQCSRPADHEIRPGVRLGHVLDEGANIRAHAGVRVTLATGFDPTLTGLMPHINGRNHPAARVASGGPAQAEPLHSNASRPGCRQSRESGSRRCDRRSAPPAAQSR